MARDATLSESTLLLGPRAAPTEYALWTALPSSTSIAEPPVEPNQAHALRRA